MIPAALLVAFASAVQAAGPCAELARRLPNLGLALCERAALTPSGAASVKGVPLYQRDVPAPQPLLLPDDKPPPAPRRVLVLGGIHGDELSSSALAFHWIAQAGDTGAGLDWRFVPVLNPDGLLLARPTRTNAHGVDLNRNFPTPHWDRDAPVYWVQRTKKDPRRWPGPSPLSEPESRFVTDTIEAWKPDVIVTVHAPYGVLDFDGPSVPPQRLGRLYLDRVGIFPGSLGHYGGVHKGVPVVTIELPSAIRTPTDAEMRQMWIDLLRWLDERLALREHRQLRTGATPMTSLARHLYASAHNNAWANHRLLQACGRLTRDEFTAPRTGFFPSIRATLNHNLTVDDYYLDAIERSLRGDAPHPDPGSFFDPEEPCATCAELAAAQQRMDQRLLAIAHALLADVALLERVIAVPRTQRVDREPLHRLLAHLYQHQVHHRGQAHSMLSGTSVAPPQLDEFFCVNDLALREDDFRALGVTEAAIWQG